MKQETQFELFSDIEALRAEVATVKRKLDQLIEPCHPVPNDTLVGDAKNLMQNAIVSLGGAVVALRQCYTEI